MHKMNFAILMKVKNIYFTAGWHTFDPEQVANRPCNFVLKKFD